MSERTGLWATALVVMMAGSAQAARVPLRVELARARAAHPEAFAAVDALRASVIAAPPPRDRRVQVARAFRALGRPALEPMLALVEPDAPALRGAPAETARVLREGALEAIGALADPRAVPTLARILDENAPPPVARSAAEALGTLCGDDEMALLGRHAAQGQRHELAAIAGLGQCRRLRAATLLAQRLDARPDDRMARAIAEAMGLLGSSWAWQAAGPAHAAEANEVGERLAESLLHAYLSYPDDVARACARALVMLERPSTAERIAAARAAADGNGQRALDRLAQRWARSRTR
jgi:hypothetical protein